MPSIFEKFTESPVVDVEGIQQLEKSNVDISGVSWLIVFLVVIMAVGVGLKMPKGKKKAEEDDSSPDADTR